jgi:hypothetical protein
MDAVYILGTGSLCQDLEIKYSLRALDQYMLDLENVFIVGDRPNFIIGVEHVIETDPTTEKWKNAFRKIKRACTLPDLSSDFLLMNDDFFMTEPFVGEEWPYYALKGSNGGVDGMNSYHVHCPIKLNKELYLKMPLDISGKGKHSPRTFYSNFYKVKTKLRDDFILRAGTGCRDFDEQIKKEPCFSISDSAMLYPPFLQWLSDMYIIPSRFEKLKL